MRHIVSCHLIDFPVAANLLMQCSPDLKLQDWVINGVIVYLCCPTHILNYTICGACTLQRPALFLKLTFALTYILVLWQIPSNERRRVFLYLHLYIYGLDTGSSAIISLLCRKEYSNIPVLHVKIIVLA